MVPEAISNKEYDLRLHFCIFKRGSNCSSDDCVPFACPYKLHPPIPPHSLPVKTNVISGVYTKL